MTEDLDGSETPRAPLDRRAAGEPSAGAPTPAGPDGTTTGAGPMVGRYRIEGKIGEGRTSEVYRAWDTLIGRRVALKKIRTAAAADDTRREALLAEARAASRVQHPAVIPVFDVLEDGGQAYLVEALTDGASLRERLRRPFSIEEALALAEECAGALEAAERMGVVHSDLKPENIFVSPSGHAVILDFGLARVRRVGGSARPAELSPAASEADTSVRQLDPELDTRPAGEAGKPTDAPTVDMDELVPRFQGGTLSYAAPEVLLGGKPDTRADIFSLGIILYEMATGRHPFWRTSAAELRRSILQHRPPAPSTINPKVPASVDALILRMLEKDPERRPLSAAALLREIRRCRDRSGRRFGGRGLTIGLIGAALLVAATGAWVARAVLPWHRSVAAGHRPLAVTDFVSLSPEPADRFFAVGLAESIRSRLAGQPGILVLEPNADIGSGLALDGSVQRSQDRLRITYRVVDRDRHTSLAGGVIEGPARDLFALQDKVVGRVARALTGGQSHGFALAGEPPTANAEAYDQYVEGLGYLQKPRDRQELEIAAGLFQKALALDSRFTLSLAALGETYWKEYVETKDPSLARRAEEVSIQARDQDPDRAEVHISLGHIYDGTGRPDDAIREFQRTLAIDPGQVSAMVGLALLDEKQGDVAGADSTFARAARLRPTDWLVHAQRGAFYSRHDRLPEALECFQRVVALTPDDARGYANVGAVLQLMGRTDEAVRAYERSIAVRPNYPAYTNLATLYRSEDRLADAIRTYRTALRLDDHDYRVWGSLAASLAATPERGASTDSAYRRAIALGESELAVNPKGALTLANLAQYHAAIGEKGEARRCLTDALKLSPADPEVLVYAAAVHETLKERAFALEMVRRGVKAGCTIDRWRRDPAMRGLVADPEFQRIVGDTAQARR